MEKIWLKSYDSGVPENIDPDQFKNINEMFYKNFMEYAKQPCLVSFDQVLSYEEVDNLSDILAGYLQNELGLKKGMRLAIMMPNTLQYPIIICAALRLGLIVVNLPFISSPEDIHQMISLTEPEVVVVLENYAPNLALALEGTKVKHIIVTEFGDLFSFFKRTLFHYVMRYVKKIKACQIPGAIPFRKIMQPAYAKQFQPVEVQPHDTAFLQFTNARDQAQPKCVELSHRNYIANTLQMHAVLSLYWATDPEKTSLSLLPLFRSSSLLQLFLAINTGFQTILIADPRDVATIVSECKKRPFSVAIAIQILFDLYLKEDKFCEMDFSKFKLCIGGGVVSSQTTVMWKTLTETMILKAHIIAEATAVTCINPYNSTEYRNSAGLPFPSSEIKVCDRNGIEMPVNHRGELWIRGPHVMKGYWRNPEKTSQVLTQDGWLKTGDIVVVDEDGYVTLIERLADLIEHAGDVTSALDIERLINTVPGVVESAVVCIKQPTGDTKIKAYVVKNSPDLKEETIMELCRRFLTVFCPHEIEFIEILPRASIGYVMKRSLRERG